MKKSQKSTPVTLIAFVLTLFVVFVIAAFLLLGKADTNAEFRTRLMSFDGNWTVKVNGSTAEAGSLPIKIVNPPSGITTIERNLPTSINEFDAIAIRNYHHLLHVRVGDDLLYAYPNLGWNGVGNIISDEWIIINLKPEYAGQPIEFLFTNTSSVFRTSFNVDKVFIGKDNDLIHYIRKITFMPFLTALIVCIIGILLLLVSEIYKTPTEQRPNMAMGAALLCFGIWLLNRSKMPLFPQVSNSLYLFSVIALMFVAPCIYLYSYHRNRSYNEISFRGYQIAIALDVLIMLSSIVIRYSQDAIAIICYALAGIGILVNGVFLFKTAFGPNSNLRTRNEVLLDRTEFLANIILPAIVLLEIIFYKDRMWTETSMLFRVGVLIYALIYMVFVFWRTFLVFSDRVAVTKRLQESQLKLMMDQIQPHFLFNTLSAIRILIKVEPETAYDAMYDFSKYLRANIDNVNNIEGIDFASEVEHIKSYVNIEKIRFGGRINAEYDIQCDDFFVPPLSIQSLVENAIQYGILPKMRGGTIWLRSYESGDYDVVEIEDNGVGFNRETAAHLFSIYASDDDKVGMESNQVLLSAMMDVMENLSLIDEAGNPIVFTAPVKNNDLTEEHQASKTMNILLRLREMSGAKFEIASTEGHGTLIRVLIPRN